MQEERPRYDPNSVLAGDDGLDEMAWMMAWMRCLITAWIIVRFRSDPQVFLVNSWIPSNRSHQLSDNFHLHQLND